MDADFDTIYTIGLFVIFMGIIFYVFREKTKKVYDEDAKIPFMDEENIKKDKKGVDAS